MGTIIPKTMYKKLIIVLLTLSVMACSKYRHSETENKEEIGRVLLKEHTPYHSESNMVYSYSYFSDSWGWRSETETTYERNDIKMETSSGYVFNQNDKEFYGKVNEGDTIIVTYSHVLNKENEIIRYKVKGYRPK